MERALHFYNASLVERLKIVNVNPKKSVIAYCNVANVLSQNCGKHHIALKLLFNAEKIQKNNGWLHMNTGLVLIHIAQIYLRMCQISESLTTLHEALAIYDYINPNYIGKIKVLQLIAHCYLLKEEFDNAKKYFKSILDVNSDNLLSSVSEVEIFSMAFEHLIYLSLEDPQNQMIHLENILNHLRQLLKQSVTEKQKLRYSNAIAKYQSLKILLLDKLSQHEERAGLLMDSIPFLCQYCMTYRHYFNCSQENYIHKLCGLRSNSHEVDFQ
ncbi:uncharacterized protein LOC106870044 [Octopus bimaculoides]|nr:uncharacterized protein LOC106870044 [Octopus bimaculoides]|eukprot:XP_014771500.1 PREDICTED: uncharacterized protein LOC106870044 [Octopus bimaculoides]